MSLRNQFRLLAKTPVQQNRLQTMIINECKTAAELGCYSFEYKFKYNHSIEEKNKIKEFLQSNELDVEFLDDNRILYISWNRSN